MNRRFAVFAIGALAMGSMSVIVGSAPVGAATNCSTLKNKFSVDESPAEITTAGTVVRTFTGRCLVPLSSYKIVDNVCNLGAPATVLNSDLSGNLQLQYPLSNCIPGIRYATLTENFGAHKVILVKDRLTAPAPCAAGAVPTIAASPKNAPRVNGDVSMQTITGECYPAMAPVTVNFTACGGGSLPATADAFGRFYLDFSANCVTSGSFPMTVISNYPPFGAILATGTQVIDP